MIFKKSSYSIKYTKGCIKRDGEHMLFTIDYFNLIIICIIVSLQILVFCGGIVVGKMIGNSINNGQYNTMSNKTQGSTNNKSNISIDSKTFVTDIKTEGMEKKYDSLGDIERSEENISSSINKLKNIKR
jgi:cytochrome c biogenesis protein ResB